MSSWIAHALPRLARALAVSEIIGETQRAPACGGLELFLLAGDRRRPVLIDGAVTLMPPATAMNNVLAALVAADRALLDEILENDVQAIAPPFPNAPEATK